MDDNKKQTGVVKFFNPKKGKKGFEAQNVEIEESLNEGDKVVFLIVKGPKGFEAQDVELDE